MKRRIAIASVVVLVLVAGVLYTRSAKEPPAPVPDDLDAAVFHAEAMMDLQPWDYYDEKLQPKGNTAEIVSTLESVIKRNPDHPGALHLYVHAVEASANPERGVAAADPEMEKLTVWDRYPLSHAVRIAERTLSAELAAARNDTATAMAAQG